jgi:hypothetical protein
LLNAEVFFTTRTAPRRLLCFAFLFPTAIEHSDHRVPPRAATQQQLHRVRANPIPSAGKSHAALDACALHPPACAPSSTKQSPLLPVSSLQRTTAE